MPGANTEAKPRPDATKHLERKPAKAFALAALSEADSRGRRGATQWEKSTGRRNMFLTF
jgi:hypothetical protein